LKTRVIDTPVRKGELPSTKHDFQNKTRIKLKLHNGEERLADDDPDDPPWPPELLQNKR